MNCKQTLNYGTHAIAHHPTKPWVVVAQRRYILLIDRINESHFKFGELHTGGIRCCAFSPDGKLIVSGSEDRTLHLWDVAMQKPIGKLLTGHDGSVTSCKFSPDGKLIVSGSEDQTLQLWDVATQKQISQPFIGHTGSVWCVAFSPDGKLIVSGSEDFTLRLWDVTTQKQIGQPLTGQRGDEVRCVAFSPDGRLIVSGSDGGLFLWDVATKKQYGQFRGYFGAADSCAFSPNGKLIVSGGRQGRHYLWDVGTQKPIGEPFVGYATTDPSSQPIWSVVFSPDGQLVVSGSGGNFTNEKYGALYLWDVATQQPMLGEPPIRRAGGRNNEVMDCVFNSDGKMIVSYQNDALHLWDVYTQKQIGMLLTGRTRMECMTFSPDGKFIVSGNFDNTVCLWDVVTQKQIGEPFIGHTDRVRCVAFSPDGKFIVSGSYGTLCLWEVATQKQIGKLKPLTELAQEIVDCAFSPDGKLIVSASHDRTLCLWDVATQKQIGELLTHTRSVKCVAFSPDGRLVVLGGYKTLFLWDVETQKEFGELLTEADSSIESCSFSPDCKLIISGSTDETRFNEENKIIRFWDIASRRCLKVIPLSWVYPITTMAFNLNNNVLIIGDKAGMISFWTVSLDTGLRFMGIPRYSTMPPWLLGATLQGCRMDKSTKSLLAQYGAVVNDVIVEQTEEKEVISKGLPLPPKTTPQSSSIFAGLFKRKSYYSNQELLTQANQLVVGISHKGTQQRYLAKLDYYHKNINTLKKADKERLIKLIDDLQRLHNNPTFTALSPAHLTTPDQKYQFKLSFGLKHRLWSTPKPIPPATSLSASSSSSSSSRTLHSNTSSSRSDSTSSTSTTTTPHK